MANDITVAAETRTTRGKNEARRLRAAGSAPAVVYGTGKDTLTVAVSACEKGHRYEYGSPSYSPLPGM